MKIGLKNGEFDPKIAKLNHIQLRNFQRKSQKKSVRIRIFHTDFREISSEFHEIFTESRQISETNAHNF